MALAMALSVPTTTTSMSMISTTASCSRGQQSVSSNLCFKYANLTSSSSSSLTGSGNQRVLLRKKSDAVLGLRRKRRALGVCIAASKRLDEAEAVDLTSDDGVMGIPAATGVYAMYDKEGKMQFVGISRRIAASVQTHLQDVPDLCGSVKVNVVDAPDKASLQEAWRLWIQEYVDTSGQAPPGNVSGVTTWTSRKNRAAKPELKLTPGPNKELNIPLTELLDKVVKDIHIVAFIKGTRTAPQCGFSHRVLTILNENGADYEVVNVLDEHYNPGLREAIKQYSNWPTIPQLYVKGEFVGGADIVSELAESGEIKTVLKK